MQYKQGNNIQISEGSSSIYKHVYIKLQCKMVVSQTGGDTATNRELVHHLWWCSMHSGIAVQTAATAMVHNATHNDSSIQTLLAAIHRDNTVAWTALLVVVWHTWYHCSTSSDNGNGNSTQKVTNTQTKVAIYTWV